MSAKLLLITSVLYFGSAIGMIESRPWMAAAILCYGVANICFVMDIK